MALMRYHALLVLLLLAGCLAENTKSPLNAQEQTSPGTGAPAPTASPANAVVFDPLPPSAYAAKVKMVLTGMPLTQEEYSGIVADPNGLSNMIDAWTSSPAFHDVMTDYFRKAFQQSDSPLLDTYISSVGVGPTFVTSQWDWFGFHTRYNLEESLGDMFSRTALSIVDNDQPFTQVLTTNTYMMNTALMSYLSARDAAPVNDSGAVQDANHGSWMMAAYPNLKFIRQATQPIPTTNSLDPADPNFLNFYDPVQCDATNNIWGVDPYIRDWSSCVKNVMGGPCAFNDYEGSGELVAHAMDHILGVRFYCDPYPASPSDPRYPSGATAATRGGVLLPSDWSDWRLVTIRKPNNGERPTIFANLAALRRSNELVLNTDYAGFMSTLAFLSKWSTNQSNQHRVTVNQALIAGLDFTFAPNTSAPSAASSADPNLHAQPGSTCYTCHSVLDPMRDMVRQSYNLQGWIQTYTTQDTIPRVGSFTLPGEPTVTGSGIAAFGAAMAASPRFSTAWTNKMCRMANSVSCDEADPEFIRVAQVFKKSNYNFKTLIRELYSSPLVTYATSTVSAQKTGAPVSIARRDAFCHAMSGRLNWPDACQLNGYGKFGDNLADTTAYGVGLRTLANSIPNTEFTRGVVAPAMPTLPNLFFVSATDELCRQWSLQMVDQTTQVSTTLGNTLPTGATWSSSDPNTALVAFTEQVMGIVTADPRAATVVAMLRQHHQQALSAGASATDALRSTFVTACRAAPTLSQGL